MKPLTNTDDPVDILDDVAHENDWELRDDYSGRGMYGATCYGIVCDNLQRAIEECAARGLTGGRSDNMGLDYILYFPQIKGIR